MKTKIYTIGVIVLLFGATLWTILTPHNLEAARVQDLQHQPVLEQPTFNTTRQYFIYAIGSCNKVYLNGVANESVTTPMYGEIFIWLHIPWFYTIIVFDRETGNISYLKSGIKSGSGSLRLYEVEVQGYITNHNCRTFIERLRYGPYIGSFQFVGGVSGWSWE